MRAMASVLQSRRTVRVIEQARPTVKAWEPGFVAVPWITVELEPEAAHQYQTAVASGWKAA
jgi:hypothetical protein